MAGDIASLGFDLDPSGIDKGVRAFDRLEAAERRVERSGKTAASHLKTGMKGAAESVEQVDRATGSASDRLRSMRTIVGTIGLVAFGRNMLTMAGNFDGAMSNVQAKLEVTKEEMVGLRDEAKLLGASTKFSATEAAEGMGFLAQAGLDMTEIAKAIGPSLSLAAAGNIELAQAADIATNVMGGFRLGVDDLPMVMDVLAKTSASTNTSVSELAQAFRRGAPIAADYKVDIVEMATAAGILANNNFKADVASTVLKNSIQRLLSPAKGVQGVYKDLNISQTDLFNKMDDGSLQFKGYANLMDVLGDAGITAQQKMILFGEEAGPGVSALLAVGGDAFRKQKAEIEEYDGAAERMARTMSDNLPGAAKALGSAWEGLNIAVAENLGVNNAAILVMDRITDVLRFAATDGVDFLAGAFKNASDLIKQAEGWPIDVIRNTGLVIASMATGFTALRGAGAVMSGIAFAMKGLTAPLVIATGVATAAVTILQNWDELAAWWKATDFKGKSADIVTTGIDAARDGIQALGEWWARPLPDKALSIATGAIGLARSAADNFFSWWDNQGLKDKAPRVVTTFVDGARAKINTFFSWWDNTPLQEKRAGVVAAVDSARAALNSFSFWWAQPLPEKAAHISSASIMASQNALNGFHSLWNDSVLKTLTPEIVSTTIDNAVTRFNAFSVEWQNKTFAEKAATIRAAGIETAQMAVDAFSTWWNTPLEQKIAKIDTTLIAGARNIVTGFYNLWNGSELQSRTPEVITTAIDNAYIRWNQFIDRWEGLTLRERVLMVETGLVNAAETAVVSLRTTWENSSFREHSPRIVTTFIDGAFEVIEGAIDLWQEWNPISWTLDLAFDAVEGAMNAIESLVDFWNAPLKEKAARITYGTLSLALDAARGLHEWWENLTFDPQSIEVTLAGAADAVENAWQAARDIGAGIKTGFAQFMADNPIIGEFFNDLIADIKTNAVRLKDGMIAAGEAMIDGMLAGLRSKADDIGDWFASQVDKWNPFADAEPEKQAEDYVDSFKEPIEKGMTEVADVVEDSFWSRMKSKIPGFRGQAEELGEAVPEGIVKGLSDGQAAVEKASEMLADSTTEPYAKTLNIRSPSRVFYQFGVWVVEGLAEGLSTGADVIHRAVVGMSESTREIFSDLGTGWIDSLTGSLRRGDGLRDTLRGIGEETKNWALDLASDFAKNEIKIFFGLDDEDGSLQKQRQKIVGFFDDVKGLFGRAGEWIGGLWGQMKTKETLGESHGDVVSWVEKTQGTFGGLFDSVSGVWQKIKGVFGNLFSGGEATAGLGGVLSTVTSFLGSAGGQITSTIGNLFGSVSGGVKSAASTIGDTLAGLAPLAGPWGAALGAAYSVGFFGGAKKLQDTGFEIGITLGDIVGQQYETFVKERAFFLGTKTINRFSEIEDTVRQEFADMVDTTLTGVESNLSALGVDIGNTIRDGLTIDPQRISDNNLEEDTAAFITEVNSEAYRLAFDRLRPEVQEQVGRMALEIGEGVAGVADAIEILAVTAGEVVAPIESMGIAIGRTFRESSEAGQALVAAFGGLEQFSDGTAALLENFYTEAERGQITLRASAADLAGFNDMLGLTGPAAIDTDREMRQLLDSLDLSKESHRQVFIAATEVADSLSTVADSGLSLDDALQTAAPSIASFDASVQAASDTAAGAAEGFDSSAESLSNLNTQGGASLDTLSAEGAASLDRLNIEGSASLENLATESGTQMSEVNNAIIGALDNLDQQIRPPLESAGEIIRETFSGAALEFQNFGVMTTGSIRASGDEWNTYVDQQINRFSEMGISITESSLIAIDRAETMGQTIARTIADTGASVSDGFASWVNSIDITTEEGRDLMLVAMEFVSSAAADYASRMELAEAGIIDSAGSIQLTLSGMAGSIDTSTAEGAALYRLMLGDVVGSTADARNQVGGALSGLDSAFSATAANLHANASVAFHTAVASGGYASSSSDFAGRSFNSANQSATFAASSGSFSNFSSNSANSSSFYANQSQNSASRSNNSASSSFNSSRSSDNSATSSRNSSGTSNYYSGLSRNAYNSANTYQRNAFHAWQDIQRWNNSIDGRGGFRDGLDRVPFDGFKAILHADEMVLPKSAADFFRDSGVPLVSPAPVSLPVSRRSGPSSSPSLPGTTPIAANDSMTREMLMVLKKILEANSDLPYIARQGSVTNIELAKSRQTIEQQLKALNLLESTNDRLVRQLADSNR